MKDALGRPTMQPRGKGLGDLVETVAKPIARIFRMKCLDEAGNLRPGSPCFKRKATLNKIRLTPNP